VLLLAHNGFYGSGPLGGHSCADFVARSRPFVHVPDHELLHRIGRSAGNVRISWPLPATGFVLEQVNVLNASPVTGWSQVPFPYQANATHISITVSAPAGNKFYRQRKP
jgi:hypothetical protein